MGKENDYLQARMLKSRFVLNVFLQGYLMNPVGQDHIVLLRHEERSVVSVSSGSKSDLNNFNCLSVHFSFETKFIGIVGERR